MTVVPGTGAVVGVGAGDHPRNCCPPVTLTYANEIAGAVPKYCCTVVGVGAMVAICKQSPAFRRSVVVPEEQNPLNVE